MLFFTQVGIKGSLESSWYYFREKLRRDCEKLMPLWFSHSFPSSFLKSLTIIPVLRSLGNLLVCKRNEKEDCQMAKARLRLDLIISAEMRSVPRASPIFRFFAAKTIFSAVGSSSLMLRLKIDWDCISGRSTRAGRFK